MGRYQAYPEYKDSGIEWLGDVPSTWTVCRLGDFALKIGSGKTPRGGSEIYRDDGVLFLRSQNIYDDGLRIETSDSVYIAEQVDEEMANTRVQSGDILLNITGGSIGRTCIVPESFPPANVNQHVCIIRLRERLRNFISYFMKSSPLKEQIDFLQNGGNREGLNFEQIRKFSTVIPTEDELDTIANFLDHETAKIDTLIEHQQQLIQLLKEKRQAVISHAVTKGLSSLNGGPNAPMKDSGVEWLGEVPAHWNVCRLKQIIKSGSSISYGIVQPGDALEDGVPFIQTTNMSKGTFELDDLQKTTQEIASLYPRSRLEGGEVILGIRASIGAAFVVPEHLKGANLSRGVARIIPNTSITSSFLVLYFRSGSVERYWSLSKQGSTFSEVSIETVRELTIPIPPVTEQVDICNFVKSKLNVLDQAENNAIYQMKLLQERRTALISACVTGKIDVRNWQAPQQ